MNTIKHTFGFLVAHQKCATPLEYILKILPKCTSNGPWVAGGALLRTYTGKALDSDVAPPVLGIAFMVLYFSVKELINKK